ncbi:hypothetical protein K443DRAFT_666141 [Laccaria amethystina LaAM-08-1]|uniref:Sortilin C-terminal domain-containing protein n=1 Tax=Laccaria amethystina LaAM-08-1 TaxID=1095629 RepID=A0A0C9WKT3_9AGAR|nr:hypothetical protein K443DRAFT_666141 [Laccaria amethystina LaAM-08-1]
MDEFGDPGSILILANDEEPTPTDHILFSTDEGDLSTNSPANDDFEMWSPCENRPEQCLFGRHSITIHHRIRNMDCTVGEQEKTATRVVLNCPCSKVDFEWYLYLSPVSEVNHVNITNHECELVPGTTPLLDSGEEFWYIPFDPLLQRTDGERPARGREHRCPGFKSHSAWFWVLAIHVSSPFRIHSSLVAFYYYRESGLARGTIRLPGEGARPAYGSTQTSSLLSLLFLGSSSGLRVSPGNRLRLM